MTVSCFVTQLPLETNRVDLDPDVKDDWGLPAMRITSTSHPDDFKSDGVLPSEVRSRFSKRPARRESGRIP